MGEHAHDGFAESVIKQASNHFLPEPASEVGDVVQEKGHCGCCNIAAALSWHHVFLLIFL